MLTGNTLLNTLVDELNELGLPNMAAELDKLYAAPGFLEMDHLTLISELISPEYKDKVSKRINNRLRAAKLIGCPAEIDECRDSKEREYLPTGIPELLSSLDFIPRGYNICILGASDTGKTYLAKAIGIKACADYRVAYFHCEELLESLVSLKKQDFKKYERKISGLLKKDLIILDDFLLHTLEDETEIKILFALLEGRMEKQKSTVICSQRAPENWKPMIMNDEISANSIVKRATKHYTVMINRR
jgi:DNA replication protein DnaC